MKQRLTDFSSRFGIRSRVILPLITICLLLSSIGGWMIHRANDQQARDHLEARAAAITHAICHLAETTGNEVDLQRFVAAMSAEKDVKLIVVASGDPLEVIAASKADWVGLPATSLPDRAHILYDLLRAIDTDRQRFDYRHDGESTVDFTVPLRTRILASNPLAWSDGAVMLHLDGRPHANQQAASTAQLLTSLLITIAIGGWATYGLISFWVLRPARQIAAVARLVAQGERNVRVDSDRSDELGQLASDIDRMLEELAKRERIETQAKEDALSCQRQMESAIAELACNNFALDQHAIVAITDLQGVITYVNDKFCEISQFDRSELIGRTHQVINSGYHPKAFWGEMWKTISQGNPWHAEVCNRAKDGTRYWVDTTVVPFKDQNGQITKFVAIRTDITARRAFEEELRQSQERFELALRGSNDGIWDWDITNGNVYYSPRFEQLLDYSSEEFPHRFDSFRDHLHPDDAGPTLRALQQHLDQRDPYDVTYRMRTKHGQWRWFRSRGLAVRDSSGTAYRMAGSVSDITEIKLIEAQLAADATHDRLTGLPNRVLILNRIERAIAKAKRRSTAFAVLFLDFDRFKLVNDTLGHDAGDDLLRQIASRLTGTLGAAKAEGNFCADYTVARLGGDEFVVLLENIANDQAVLGIADRLLQTLAQAYSISDHKVTSTASIGIVFGSAADDKIDDILRDADMAMYEAKRNGKGCYVVFDAAMQRRQLVRMQLESEFASAIESGQLALEYEPIIELQSGLIRSFEVHLCWHHPSLGRIESSDLLAIVEESQCAAELTQWTLDQAGCRLQTWRREHGDKVPGAMKINLTSKQFALPSLSQILSSVINRFELEPASIELEITESAYLGQTKEVAERIKSRSEIGVCVAIDHFGAGTSSFRSLHQLPVHSLKIDQSLLADIKSSKQAVSLIHGLAVMVRDIGLPLIATGIDSVEQLIALQGLGCEFAQGSYFGDPMPPDPFIASVLRHRYRGWHVQGAMAFSGQWAEHLEGSKIAGEIQWQWSLPGFTSNA